MVSRLDRLFILLDTGSNEAIRVAAAKQLGEVQRVQPSDLHYLLNRIKEYTGRFDWETRVAAGHAIKCILEHVERPPPPIKSEQDYVNQANGQHMSGQLIDGIINTRLIFQTFDLDKIVAMCPSLLSMDTIDSEEQDQPSSSRGARAGRAGRKGSTVTGSRKTSKEQLLRQRQLINKELGISMVDSLNIGVKSTDIITNDDLQSGYEADASSSQSNQQQDARRFLREILSNYKQALERLAQAGQQPKDEGQKEDLSVKNMKILQDMAQEYEEQLLATSWEIRHGSAIALREIVRAHGKYLGRQNHIPNSVNDELNQVWLIDMALKAICVLGLDRFGDFLFDQVVAPVRENAAQLLGCCVASMLKPNASATIEILLKMLQSSSWETRHGGILGLKYTLSVLSEEVTKEILRHSFDAIFKCLGDPNDDVSAEAAASLVPVKDLLIETIPEKAPKLIKFLWEHLANLDDLTSSTSNIILLLASLITSNSAQLEPEELIRSIPKLWPLLSHSSTTVRISVLKALITLIKPQEKSCLHWMPEELLTTALRLLFQRAIVECMQEVRSYIEEAWMVIIKVDKDDSISEAERFKLLKSTSQHLNYWLCLTMQPSNSPIDRGNPLWLNLRLDGTVSDVKPDGEVYIGSSTFNADTLDQQKSQIIKCRILSTNLLGTLFSSIVSDPKGSPHIIDSLKYISDMFTHYLITKSANQRMISGWALEAWARHQLSTSDCSRVSERVETVLSDNLKKQLNIAIQETTLCYDELATSFTRLQQEAREFVAALVASNIPTSFPNSTDKRIIYNLNQIQSMCELDLEAELTRANSKKCTNTSPSSQDARTNPSLITLLAKKSTLLKSYQTTKSNQKNLSIATLSSLSCALISWWIIPEKLRLVIDPLLDSIESETELDIQEKSVDYLVRLVDLLCRDLDRNQILVENILDRLTKSIRVFSEYDGGMKSATTDIGQPSDRHRILLLDNLQRRAEQALNTSRRQSSVGSGTATKRFHPIAATHDIEGESVGDQQVNSNGQSVDVRMRGASQALNHMVKHFSLGLPVRLPTFWTSLTTGLESNIRAFIDATQNGVHECTELTTKLIRDMSLVQVVGESLHPSFRPKLLASLPDLIGLLASSSPLIRHQSSRCIGTVCKLMFTDAEDMIARKIIPMLDSDDILARCGSMEAIAHIIEHIQCDSTSNIDMFIVHVLRRMSDQSDQVRLMATHCFGKLLSLMPFKLTTGKDGSSDSKSNDPPFASDESTFIEQLLNPKKLVDYVIPFETNAKLRSYQQEGLNWLAFLSKFNLHGILCDEMGLGKTFMTICIVASNHYSRATKVDSSIKKNLPSLIVCPSTLVEHWLLEIEKFVPSGTRTILNPVSYTGSLADRAAIRSRLSDMFDRTKAGQADTKHGKPINLIVTSYDALRNDSDFFRSIEWNYCVLDEGHIIKNGRTKLSRTVRFLIARHRLILTGTPIQNNVTELWSLFDFLMPGFLGSERQFNSRFARPILQSRESKCSKKDLEAGALAMEALHKQVLPFILRRLKEDVLDDLPPKIIQDYYCELSQLQAKLYEDFTRSRLCQDVTRKSLHQLEEECIQADSAKQKESKNHVFQALQYMKNVCNHPKLVLTHKHSQYDEIKKQMQGEKKTLDDINHSSKLKALKQLLIDCGIGIATQANDDNQQTQTPSQQAPVELESVVNQHRALVFCQLRSMVEIIENDLFKKHLPSITFLKLDGSVPPNQRQSIVSRFNNDPSIDVLLLTTQIGGLGLNLTGADTVIFVEHDWNPMRDLQAMDRAHRIGQKKVVNVYRLITKDTLEEKIMGLQKFKTMVSNTVINQDNTGLGTMNVEQLLDLFNSSKGEEAFKTSGESKSSESKKANFMDLLPELWDQQQYETEYDLSNFVSSLKN